MLADYVLKRIPSEFDLHLVCFCAGKSITPLKRFIWNSYSYIEATHCNGQFDCCLSCLTSCWKGRASTGWLLMKIEPSRPESNRIESHGTEPDSQPCQLIWPIENGPKQKQTALIGHVSLATSCLPSAHGAPGPQNRPFHPKGCLILAYLLCPLPADVGRHHQYI